MSRKDRTETILPSIPSLTLLVALVIFLGSVFHSHMCQQAAAGKIKNLLITVNESGSSTGETQEISVPDPSYQKLKRIGQSEYEVDIVIADSHKSRLNSFVMDHCDANNEAIHSFFLLIHLE